MGATFTLNELNISIVIEFDMKFLFLVWENRHLKIVDNYFFRTKRTFVFFFVKIRILKLS